MVARRGASVELLNYRSALFGFVTFPTKRNRRLSEKSRDLPHSLLYVDSHRTRGRLPHTRSYWVFRPACNTNSAVIMKC
jgi:hypothetical protein